LIGAKTDTPKPFLQRTANVRVECAPGAGQVEVSDLTG